MGSGHSLIRVGGYLCVLCLKPLLFDNKYIFSREIVFIILISRQIHIQGAVVYEIVV